MIAWKGFAYIPVIFIDGVGINDRKSGWWFYDETWSEVIGPFHSRIEAAAQLLDYCRCELNDA